MIRDDVAGVYYAQVRSAEQKLIGIAGEAEQLTQNKSAHVKTTPTQSGWVQQRALWREQLNGLATEIAAGDARVNPLPNACRHCDLKPLCRVDEKRRDAEQLCVSTQRTPPDQNERERTLAPGIVHRSSARWLW